MTVAMQLSRQDRVLVFAPHPDDETLAAGELIQLARAAGAAVRIVFVTDGDNNPWPQRWLERRWRIDDAARARWGARRRREAFAALAALGIDGESAIGFLGWPDQGLTERLMNDDTAIVALAQEIAAFAPTHVVMPALGDRHPDHSALRVMLDLALLRSGNAGMRLGYVVHGDEPAGSRCVLSGDPARQHRKQLAMSAHASQVALSRRRLLELAARTETFEIAREPAAVSLEKATVVRIPHRTLWSLRCRHQLLLVLATRTETLRFRTALPRFPQWRATPVRCTDARQRRVSIEWGRGAWNVSLPPLPAPLVALYAKLDRAQPRLVIFDEECWQDIADLLLTPALALRPAAGLT